MLKNRLGRIALAAVLAFGVLAIGTMQSSAIYVMNGFQGPYRVIKSFDLVSFEFGVWTKHSNSEAMEHECTNNQGYCYFHVARQLFLDNCTTSAADGTECGVGAAELQGIGLPGGFGSLYRCPKGAVVTTVNDLLWVPELCYPNIDT